MQQNKTTQLQLTGADAVEGQSQLTFLYIYIYKCRHYDTNEQPKAPKLPQLCVKLSEGARRKQTRLSPSGGR